MSAPARSRARSRRVRPRSRGDSWMRVDNDLLPSDAPNLSASDGLQNDRSATLRVRRRRRARAPTTERPLQDRARARSRTPTRYEISFRAGRARQSGGRPIRLRSSSGRTHAKRRTLRAAPTSPSLRARRSCVASDVPASAYMCSVLWPTWPRTSASGRAAEAHFSRALTCDHRRVESRRGDAVPETRVSELGA